MSSMRLGLSSLITSLTSMLTDGLRSTRRRRAAQNAQCFLAVAFQLRHKVLVGQQVAQFLLNPHSLTPYVLFGLSFVTGVRHPSIGAPTRRIDGAPIVHHWAYLA